LIARCARSFCGRVRYHAGFAVKTLFEKIADRDEGICLYGIAPPKQATEAAALAMIAQQQTERVRALGPFPPIVEREHWLRAATKLAKDIGTRKFLELMLDELGVSLEAIEDIPDEPNQGTWNAAVRTGLAAPAALL
jgi:hypothetical protein